MQELIKAKAIELLENGTVDRVLGWKAGEFFYDLTPAVFTSREEIEKHGLDLLGVVPQDETVYQYDAEGKPSVDVPEDAPIKQAVHGLFDQLPL